MHYWQVAEDEVRFRANFVDEETSVAHFTLTLSCILLACCWLVCVVRVFLFFVLLVCTYRPFHSWVYTRFQALGYKNCHYRYDERSNGPKKSQDMFQNFHVEESDRTIFLCVSSQHVPNICPSVRGTSLVSAWKLKFRPPEGSSKALLKQLHWNYTQECANFFTDLSYYESESVHSKQCHFFSKAVASREKTENLPKSVNEGVEPMDVVWECMFFFLLLCCAHHNDGDSLEWMTSLCIKCYTPKKGEYLVAQTAKPPQTTNKKKLKETQVFPLMWNSETSSQFSVQVWEAIPRVRDSRTLHFHNRQYLKSSVWKSNNPSLQVLTQSTVGVIGVSQQQKPKTHGNLDKRDSDSFHNQHGGYVCWCNLLLQWKLCTNAGCLERWIMQKHANQIHQINFNPAKSSMKLLVKIQPQKHWLVFTKVVQIFKSCKVHGNPSQSSK